MLIAAVWLASGWYSLVVYYSNVPGDHFAIVCGFARLDYVTGPANRDRRVSEDFPTFDLARIEEAPRFYWRLPYCRAAGLEPDGSLRTQTTIILPLWLLLLVIGLPTCLLWWRNRRRFPHGHCRNCGYDLTGNVSGRCPECGEAA